MRLVRKERRYVTPSYGPAVVDRERASDTLTLAERALRRGDARLAEETYQRVLGKLGPFAEPIWRTDEATDARTRAQCHARLAALAFDDGDYDRSLHQTALAAAARHHAIEVDRCSGDDIRFLITAMVHSATVHDRVGAHHEAMEASAVALEFARFSRTQTHDDHTRRSIAAAQRAAACLYEELHGRGAGDDPESVDADTRARVRTSAGADWLDEVLNSDDAVIDLADDAARRDLLATASIDVLGIPDEPVKPNRLRPASFADLVPEVIDLTDQPEEQDGSDPSDGIQVPDVIDLTDDPASRPGPDGASESEPPRGVDRRPDPFAPLESFTPLGSFEPVVPSPRPAGALDLLDEVTHAAARHPAATSSSTPPVPTALATSAPSEDEPVDDLDDLDDLVDQPVDDRFARPDRRAQRQAALAAPTIDEPDLAAAPDPAVPAQPVAAVQAGPAPASPPARVASAPILIPPDRRSDQPNQGESAAQLVGRSRGQSLLARVLLGHSDSEAAINAHRAVRTATRARQWAKEEPDALPAVALNLIEALVVRSDVLVSTGHDEVARTDLRRARAIAEQLWQACPTPTNAVAAVVVAVRSVGLETMPGHEATAQDQLAEARTVLVDALGLGVALPDVLVQAAVLLGDEGIGDEDSIGEANRERLGELGDRLLDHLQARDQDPAELETAAPTVVAS